MLQAKEKKKRNRTITTTNESSKRRANVDIKSELRDSTTNPTQLQVIRKRE